MATRSGVATPEEPVEGASPNEQLLAAAKSDSEELLLQALGMDAEGNTIESASEKVADINFQDGLGNTALHYAITHASTGILEHLLTHDQCDVDLQNKLMHDTPLHLAVKFDEVADGRQGLRAWLVEQLVEAGANPLIKNKYSLRPIDLLPPPPPPTRPGAAAPDRSAEEQAQLESDEAVRTLIRRAEAEIMMGGGGNQGDGGDDGDIADEDDFIDADDVASD